MKEETTIQNLIRIALSERGCIVHRANVGVFYTPQGEKIKVGVEGHTDLYGHRPDGKAFYIEVKTEKGKPSKKQLAFISGMANSGAIAGIARSPVEAVRLVFGGGYDC